MTTMNPILCIQVLKSRKPIKMPNPDGKGRVPAAVAVHWRGRPRIKFPEQVSVVTRILSGGRSIKEVAKLGYNLLSESDELPVMTCWHIDGGIVALVGGDHNKVGIVNGEPDLDYRPSLAAEDGKGVVIDGVRVFYLPWKIM